MTTTTEGLLEQLVRGELQRVLAPVIDAIIKMQGGKTSPHISVTETAAPAPVKRGRVAVRRGKPASAAPVKAKASKKTRAADAAACAVIGCDKPARSRGLCAVHYQKMRNLLKRGELPETWKKDAHEPQSLKDIKLRRGRPGKASAEAAAEAAPVVSPADTIAEGEEQLELQGVGRPLVEWLANAGA